MSQRTNQKTSQVVYRLSYRKVALMLAGIGLVSFILGGFILGGFGGFQTAEALKLPFFGKKHDKRHKPGKAGKVSNPKPASGKTDVSKASVKVSNPKEATSLGAPVPSISPSKQEKIASVAPVTALMAIESGVHSATTLTKPSTTDAIVKQYLFRNAFLSRPPIAASQSLPIASYIQLSNKKVAANDARLFAEAIVYFCQFYRVNPKLVASMIAVESSYRSDAISSSGAIGLGQLKPDTANWLGVSDPFDPIENIGGMTRYLAWLIQRYQGSYDHAVSAYYQGQGTVDRNGITEACIPYLYKVNGALAKF
ncbi:MAG: lytic transglycosylase domain-containing protein [Vampirovibrionales bacterium]|nr:lytic transglycosylase domain-containing protein [Vampirovibrionales bacterium]